MSRSGALALAAGIAGVLVAGQGCAPASKPEGPLADGPRVELAVSGMTCTA